MASPPPCWTRAQKCRLQASGGPTSGGKLLGSIGTRADTLEGLEGTKNRPRIDQGRKLRYSRFFRGLPDDEDGKQQDKQDDQALHLLSSSSRRSRSALHSAAYAEPSRIPQARRYRWRSTIHWSRSRIASVVMACAFMAHFLHSPIVRANLRKSSASSPLTHNRPVRAYSASRSTALFISSFVMVCFLHSPGGRVNTTR